MQWPRITRVREREIVRTTVVCELCCSSNTEKCATSDNETEWNNVRGGSRDWILDIARQQANLQPIIAIDDDDGGSQFCFGFIMWQTRNGIRLWILRFFIFYFVSCSSSSSASREISFRPIRLNNQQLAASILLWVWINESDRRTKIVWNARRAREVEYSVWRETTSEWVTTTE